MACAAIMMVTTSEACDVMRKTPPKNYFCHYFRKLEENLENGLLYNERDDVPDDNSLMELCEAKKSLTLDSDKWAWVAKGLAWRFYLLAPLMAMLEWTQI